MRRLILVLVAVLALSVAAIAAPPETMNFQGTLFNNDGTPVPDGNYSLTFRIYNVANGGAPLWTETQNTSVSGSIFNVILGIGVPLSLPFENQYWLSVQVGAEPQMTPRVPLTAAPYALNVADGKVVTSLEGLKDDVNLVAGANVNISTSGQNITIAATGAVADNDWNVSGPNMSSIPLGNVGIGINAPAEKLHVTNGNIGVGTPSAVTGELRAYHSGSANPSFLGGDFLGQGAQLQLYQEDGSRHTYIEPDANGEGGFFGVDGEVGFFFVDGTAGASDSPRVSILGGNTSMTFDTNLTGDSSVLLPSDAISNLEILDEPGIASRIDATSGITLTTSTSNLTSRSITVPTSGFVIAMASYEVDMNTAVGSAAGFTIGISDVSGSLPANQDVGCRIPINATAGNFWEMPSANQALFQVAAGTHTFYLVGSGVGTGTNTLWDVQFNLVFVPTAYGAYQPTLAKAGEQNVDQLNTRAAAPLPTDADIAAERAESESFYRNQRDDELATMRAELEELKRIVGNLDVARTE